MQHYLEIEKTFYSIDGETIGKLMDPYGVHSKLNIIQSL